MAERIRDLLDDVRREAERVDIPVDSEVYRRSGRDHMEPILFAGSFDAPLCVVGRDLGKDEVRVGQPLIGAAGRLVRSGIIRARAPSNVSDENLAGGKPSLEEALNHAFLTNTVPFKPIGNKAYPDGIRERFRPFLERLLINHWQGRSIVTLGTQAFAWFTPYGDEAEFRTAGATDARFEHVFRCTLPGFPHDPRSETKTVMVYPLPHPSPLNRRWFSRFPTMLAARLEEVRAQSTSPCHPGKLES
jgi:uracil-DNA glycosylase